MKQVTGATNNKPEIKNVSIRLRLDGHSFSEEKLDIPAKEKKTVEIEVLTGKTMLVPREVFDAKAAPALMRITEWNRRRRSVFSPPIRNSPSSL